jgi:hypothetical protein
VLFEAAVAVGFFALSVPFGYLSRTVKQSAWPPVKKWSVFLGLVHTPVIPLIVFVKVVDVSIEFELLLVALVLCGHVAGILAHRQLHAARAPAPAASSIET